jgi:glycosyltransferase involved in cell wall biosynthesis
MDQNSRILIIIPCYNEERNLPALLTDLQKEIRPYPNAVILAVNDNSSDQTESVLSAGNILHLNHPINMGYNYAIQTGLKYGVKQNYDYFLFMDADGQHRPEEINKLITSYNDTGTDLVIGSRFSSGFRSSYKIPLFRKLGMIFLSFVTSILTGNKIKDTTSGFQFLNKKVANALIYIYEAEFPDAEVLVLLKLLNFKIKETQVIMKNRNTGQSMHNYLSSIYYPIRVLTGIVLSIGRYFYLRAKLRNV